jgi:PAS domain S-box-containing protein
MSRTVARVYRAAAGVRASPTGPKSALTTSHAARPLARLPGFSESLHSGVLGRPRAGRLGGGLKNDTIGRRSRPTMKFVRRLGARWRPCGPLAASCDGMHPKSDHDSLYSIVVLGLLEANASEVTTLCSTEGVLLYVSAAVGPMLGWKPAQLTGRVADDFVHPAEKDSVRTARAAALGTAETVITTQRFLASSGRYLWTESATRQIVDQRVPGGIVVLVSIRNIADRKLVARRLPARPPGGAKPGSNSAMEGRTCHPGPRRQRRRRRFRDRLLVAGLPAPVSA